MGFGPFRLGRELLLFFVFLLLLFLKTKNNSQLLNFKPKTFKPNFPRFVKISLSG